jgi:hypothetical protein
MGSTLFKKSCAFHLQHSTNAFTFAGTIKSSPARGRHARTHQKLLLMQAALLHLDGRVAAA